MYICVWIYVYHLDFDSRNFVFAWWLTLSPYSTKQNPLDYRSLPMPSIIYPFVVSDISDFFAEAVKSYKLRSSFSI